MSDKVVFHLAKYLPRAPWLVKTLYQQIKELLKTSEWRDANAYWLERLTFGGKTYVFFPENKTIIDLTNDLKVHMAWFVEGYPKNSIPRLEAEITGLFYHPDSKQLEIQFKVIEERGSQLRNRTAKEAARDLKTRYDCAPGVAKASPIQLCDVKIAFRAIMANLADHVSGKQKIDADNLSHRCHDTYRESDDDDVYLQLHTGSLTLKKGNESPIHFGALIFVTKNEEAFKEVSQEALTYIKQTASSKLTLKFSEKTQ